MVDVYVIIYFPSQSASFAQQGAPKLPYRITMSCAFTGSTFNVQATR
jgi:hypothetical protein